MPFHQNPPAEAALAGKGLRTPDAATLPTASGQYDGLPPNVGMQLGPFTPKNVSNDMPHRRPSDSYGLPTASGQNPGYPASFDANPGRMK